MSERVITVLYFARLAELAGTRRESLPADGVDSGTALLQAVQQRHPALAGVTRIRLAINQTHCPATAAITAGDEVALFEPVTGG